MRYDAVFFDLYETLVTEFDPHWAPQPSIATRLGIPEETFNAVWTGSQRMTSEITFRDVLVSACVAAGVSVDSEHMRTIEQVEAERVAAKARPLLRVAETGHAKPEPEIYLIACHRLGVSPGRAAFVGDGGSGEFHGAGRAGLTPYAARWFTDRWPRWRRTRDNPLESVLEIRSPVDLVPTLTA